MSVEKSTAFIVTVVIMVATLSTFVSCTNSKGCSPRLFAELDDHAIATCHMLYQKMEKALLIDLNMYKLRHLMFPNERAEPLVVEISYNVTALQQTNTSCPGAESLTESDDDEEDIRLVDLENETFQMDLTWTSSVTLSIIDPKDLDFLQPAVLTLTNPVVRDYLKVSNENSVCITLTIDKLTCTPSKKQIEDVLGDLTTKVIKILPEKKNYDNLYQICHFYVIDH